MDKAKSVSENLRNAFCIKKPAEQLLRGKGLWDKRYELLRSWQDGICHKPIDKL